jgi:hypothetical protein
MLKFKVSKKELLTVLKQMTAFAKFGKLPANQARCELTLSRGQLKLVSGGFTQTLSAESDGGAKISLLVGQFYDIIKNHKLDSVEIAVLENTVKIGPLSFSAETTFMESDRILRSIQLPINYNRKDLRELLEENYTYDELQFNGFIPALRKEKAKVWVDLEKAYLILKEYGISYNELETLLRIKMPGIMSFEEDTLG